MLHPFASLRAKLTQLLVDRGADPVQAAVAVAGIGNGEILQWLLTHGPDLVKLVETILTLLALVPKAPVPAA
ncbi:MAG: hypothetical protein JWO38_6839 [Gemmataceae bacterium]|nr:hypothetical protein [Gemmataceae bacterium]